MNTRVRAGLLTVLVFALTVPPAFGDEQESRDPRAVAVPRGQVEDRFFAFVVGLIARDSDAGYTLDPLLDAFPEYLEMPDDTPMHRLERFSRGRVGRADPERIALNASGPVATSHGNEPPRTAELSLSFDESFSYPLPFDVLGYHPGDVEVSGSITVLEQAYPAHAITVADGSTETLSPFIALRLVEGTVFFDFDALVDIFAMGAYDDLEAQVALIFRHDGRWYAVLAGEGHRNRIHEWTFDLASTSFMRKPPRELRGVSHQFF
jgi:hypothetical protein